MAARLPGQHTNDFLAQELEAAGLSDMAAKARKGHYHDYMSPLDLPCIALSNDLAKAATPAALALRHRHHNGEFDATYEESEDWINSPDGQACMAMLSPKLRDKLKGKR
jgi:hypothetical protein